MSVEQQLEKSFRPETIQAAAPRHSRTVLRTARYAAAIVSLGALAFLLPNQHIASAAPNGTSPGAAEGHPPKMLENSAPFSFADLVERVGPAVVTITSEVTVADNDEDEGVPKPFRDLLKKYNQGQPQQQQHKGLSAGSGFIIDKSGYIVTNNHVIDSGKKITVKLADGRSFPARLIGADAVTDVALLKVDSDKPFPIVAFGDDKKLRVGDWVVAVGNPWGFSNTVTAGIVSSLGRDIEPGQQYTSFIQIDAPINQGNSGGPTFNLRGEVVGMNSIIVTPSGGSIGLGFAIPASLIHEVVAQLKEHGRVARGYLGVNIQSVTPEIAESLGIKYSKGAIVSQLVPGGPAAKAGFQQGDIVTAINGQSIEDATDLTRRVASIPMGQVAVFSISRQGKSLQVKATVGARPELQQVSSRVPTGHDDMPSTTSVAGLGLAELTPETKKHFRISDGTAAGAVITKVDPQSDAADKGLQPGDVVLRIGSRPVRTPADFQAGISDAQKSGREAVLVLVMRSAGGTGFVAIDIGHG